MPRVATLMNSCGRFSSGNTLLTGSMTMTELALHLKVPSGRLVLNKTGLGGAFAIKSWPPMMMRTTDPAPALVMDHIERPSEN